MDLADPKKVPSLAWGARLTVEAAAAEEEEEEEEHKDNDKDNDNHKEEETTKTKDECVSHTRPYKKQKQQESSQIYPPSSPSTHPSSSMTTTINKKEERSVSPSFITLIENFGDESAILQDYIFPFLGPDQYRFIAGINQKMRQLYTHFIQSKHQRLQNRTTGTNIFRSESRARLYLSEQQGLQKCLKIYHYLAQNGHVSLMQAIYEEGYHQLNKECRYSVCEYAAKNRNVDALKWARLKGCEWDRFTCAAAAEFGNLEVLKWARQNGCPWDASTC
eukprot:CAMPEP_0202445344 /NCGR_PEP_ID=MMETSP1360-20130828/4181_1 /ASSEMBLY_ACC=CAM_ASM_000848 /TAXON_ID=515479 /ORGANISM="Licmophora paradoxa, Strain CCMP2313" /LENGTH=275 /DNA_ID=CAMNT_0049061569 /DNA_START=586 /DNA_END=1410 /DNA_ORIENTATION=+